MADNMFAIKYQHRTRLEPEKERVFYINDPKPYVNDDYRATWFEANGDELTSIRFQFDNLPITKGDICSWTGQMAEFVFRNLTQPVS